MIILVPDKIIPNSMPKGVNTAKRTISLIRMLCSVPALWKEIPYYNNVMRV